MLNRSTIQKVCHGVLATVLCLVALPLRAGGPEPSKPQPTPYLEKILSTHKGSFDVEWELEKIPATHPYRPNLYRIELVEPVYYKSASLLIKGKPVAHLTSHVRSFKFDFTIYGEGELEITLVAFDAVKAGFSTKTIEVLPVPGITQAVKK